MMARPNPTLGRIPDAERTNPPVPIPITVFKFTGADSPVARLDKIVFVSVTHIIVWKNKMK